MSSGDSSLAPRAALGEAVGLARCVRSKVGALALVNGEQVALGWNFAVGGDCALNCPRARAVEVEPGVSSYDEGPTRCIAMHAEEHVIALLRGSEMDFRWEDVMILVTREPCYRCADVMERLGVRWIQVDPILRDGVSSCASDVARA